MSSLFIGKPSLVPDEIIESDSDANANRGGSFEFVIDGKGNYRISPYKYKQKGTTEHRVTTVETFAGPEAYVTGNAIRNNCTKDESSDRFDCLSDTEMVSSNSDGATSGSDQIPIGFYSHDDACSATGGGAAHHKQDTETSNPLHFPVRTESYLPIGKYTENNRLETRMTQKYHPKFWMELVGQGMVSRTLSASVAKEHVAPFYLFHGPRGTGKTCAARLFGMALNCTSFCTEKPCGECEICFNKTDITELDATRHYAESHSIEVLVQTIKFCDSDSRYQVFIIDECQMWSTGSWATLLNGIEECLSRVVFIFITTDITQLPEIALCRCLKVSFSKIKDSDIYWRLKEIAAAEAIGIDDQILGLMARKASGSIRTAMTYLEQLRLPERRASPSTVCRLIGIIPDEALIKLLGLAFSSDPTNTVRYIRELTESGNEPRALVLQLIKFITDILDESHTSLGWMELKEMFSHKDHSSQDLLDRLCIALKILSQAEKQLRSSNNDTIWLTAALLQLSPDVYSYSDPGLLDGIKDDKYKLESHVVPKLLQLNNDQPQVHTMPPKIMDISREKKKHFETISIQNSEIWKRVLERIQPGDVRKLLQARGKLMKVIIYQDGAEVHLKFGNTREKETVDLLQATLSTTFQDVFACPVVLKIGRKLRTSKAPRKRNRKRVKLARVQKSWQKSRIDITGESSKEFESLKVTPFRSLIDSKKAEQEDMSYIERGQQIPESADVHNNLKTQEDGKSGKCKEVIDPYPSYSKIDTRHSKLAMLCWNKNKRKAMEQGNFCRDERQKNAKAKAMQSKGKLFLKFGACKDTAVSNLILRKQNSTN